MTRSAERLRIGSGLKPLAELAWRRILDLAASKPLLYDREAMEISRAGDKWEAVRALLVDEGLILVGEGGDIQIASSGGWKGAAIDITAEQMQDLSLDFPYIGNMRGALNAIDAEIADDPIRAMRWRVIMSDKLRRIDMYAQRDTEEKAKEPAPEQQDIMAKKVALWRATGQWNELLDGPAPDTPFSRVNLDDYKE